jgi:hypothetical protein
MDFQDRYLGDADDAEKSIKDDHTEADPEFGIGKNISGLLYNYFPEGSNAQKHQSQSINRPEIKIDPGKPDYNKSRYQPQDKEDNNDGDIIRSFII